MGTLFYLLSEQKHESFDLGKSYVNKVFDRYEGERHADVLPNRAVLTYRIFRAMPDETRVTTKVSYAFWLARRVIEWADNSPVEFISEHDPRTWPVTGSRYREDVF